LKIETYSSVKGQEYATAMMCEFMQALTFGMKYQGTYMDSDLPGLKDHGKHYPSSNHLDELSWGNLWMYFATGVSFSSCCKTIAGVWVNYSKQAGCS